MLKYLGNGKIISRSWKQMSKLEVWQELTFVCPYLQHELYIPGTKYIAMCVHNSAHHLRVSRKKIWHGFQRK